MNLTQLAQAKEKFEEVLKLDAEIKEIDKLANLIANGVAKVNLTLAIHDTTVKEPVKELMDNEDPFDRISRLLGDIPRIGTWGGTPEPKKDNGQQIKSELSDYVGLNILAILLSEKQAKRAKLLNSLSRMGVAI